MAKSESCIITQLPSECSTFKIGRDSQDQSGKEGGPGFLLEPKGTWLHAGYHLTSATTGAQILSVPFAIAALGWGSGLLFLSLGCLVSFYAYMLQCAVLEHLAKQGKRYSRFADLSREVLGDKWSSYFVAPLQFIVCFATVVSCIVLGGQSLKAMALVYSHTKKTLSLYQFTMLFGVINLVLSHLPSFHSLRHLNLLSLLANIIYCTLAVYGSVSAGASLEAPIKDYSLVGSPTQKVFGVFNSLSILSNVYGNLVLVEIHATISPPTFGKMKKGLLICYLVILITLFPVGISGYWAFGNTSNGNILMNMFSSSGVYYVPKWSFIMTYGLIFIQLVVSSLVYAQPTFSTLEEKIVDDQKSSYSLRNIVPRFISRSIFTIMATLLAAMLPFFSSFNAILGAMGYTPLVFVIPMIFYIIILKPTRHMITFWINVTLIITFSIISILGCLASIHQFIIDMEKYHLFANI